MLQGAKGGGCPLEPLEQQRILHWTQRRSAAPILLFVLCCGWSHREEEGTGPRHSVPGVGSFGGTGFTSYSQLRRALQHAISEPPEALLCTGRMQHHIWDVSADFGEPLRALRTYSRPPNFPVLCSGVQVGVQGGG